LLLDKNLQLLQENHIDIKNSLMRLDWNHKKDIHLSWKKVVNFFKKLFKKHE
jgi:hypothetical protein